MTSRRAATRVGHAATGAVVAWARVPGHFCGARSAQVRQTYAGRILTQLKSLRLVRRIIRALESAYDVSHLDNRCGPAHTPRAPTTDEVHDLLHTPSPVSDLALTH